MTPPAWTEYARRALEREQERPPFFYWCWYPRLHPYEAGSDGVCVTCGVTGSWAHTAPEQR